MSTTKATKVGRTPTLRAQIPMLIAPAKYCSACGEKLDECTCYDQTITISIGISRELIRGITNLTALLPRIQISSNRALAADKSLTTDHAQ